MKRTIIHTPESKIYSKCQRLRSKIYKCLPEEQEKRIALALEHNALSESISLGVYMNTKEIDWSA